MMKRISAIAALLIALLSIPVAYSSKASGRIMIKNLKTERLSKSAKVSFDMVLDSLRLGRNNQFVVTPVLTDGRGNTEVFSSVLINGRNMQLVYERGGMKDLFRRYNDNISTVMKRENGLPQSAQFSYEVPMKPWMLSPSTYVRLDLDTCGCGHALSSATIDSLPANFKPNVVCGYVVPPVTEQPELVHEGEARVQFEVDKTELHTQPYVCRSGQRIDNRAQLKVIDDSVKYALSDPLVEISRIGVTGYASPESPYTHNEYLATNRSRALADYLAERYNLPADRRDYGAVPENWIEFRKQVLDARDITKQQRQDLLELIDRPCYGPADYDAKEKELKTSPKFAKLYRSKILPEWFPRLRATRFEIRTRLKPMPDEQLAEVIKTNPGLLSLNQMFRVARLYKEGSPEFNEVIRTALKYYPNDPIANLNAGVADLKAGEYAEAKPLLLKAGNLPEAKNALGVIAVEENDLDAARKYFEEAGKLPEALENLKALGND